MNAFSSEAYNEANIFLGLIEYELNSLLCVPYPVDHISVLSRFDLERCLLNIQQISANKKPHFGCSLLFLINSMFLNNSPLFYPLFYLKVAICFLYNGVSYSQEPAVC